MKATETLEHEHRVIEEVASACGVCAEVLRGGTKVPIDVLESIVDFFRKYGNRYHRQAEEALLSVLHDKGVPAAACPIVVINYETQNRQTLVDQLTSAVIAYVESGGAVRETLVSTLQALAKSSRITSGKKSTSSCRWPRRYCRKRTKTRWQIR